MNGRTCLLAIELLQPQFSWSRIISLTYTFLLKHAAK